MNKVWIAAAAAVLAVGGAPGAAQQTAAEQTAAQQAASQQGPGPDASGAVPPRAQKPSRAEQLRPLIDQFIQAVTPPRPAPPQPADVPLPSATPTPAPAPAPKAEPAVTAGTPAPAPVRPVPRAAPAAIVVPSPPPAAAPRTLSEPEIAQPAAAVPAAVAKPVAVAATRVERLAAPPAPADEPLPWLAILAGVIAIAAVTAAAAQLRSRRLIARTRGMLSLASSLDTGAGACSESDLALAQPAVAIRSRLDLGEMRLG